MKMSQVPHILVVKSLMFAMIFARLNIAWTVGSISWFMMNHGQDHWNIMKKILRYIKGTYSTILCYGGSDITVRGYVDLDFVGNLD